MSAAVERVLGSSVDHDAVLMAAGLDSMGTVELVSELEKFAKVDLTGMAPVSRCLPKLEVHQQPAGCRLQPINYCLCIQASTRLRPTCTRVQQ